MNHAVYNIETESFEGYSRPDSFVPAPSLVLVPLPPDWDESTAADAVLVDGTLILDASEKLARVKARRIAKIKREAALLISATDWRVTRANEQAALLIVGAETVEEVLRAREAIRRASNRAESEVSGLASVAAVQAYTWGVTVADEVEEAPPF